MAIKEVYTDLDGLGKSRLKNFIIESTILIDSVVREFTAGEDINGGRAVYVGDDGKVYVFLPSNIDKASKFIGISETSSSTGEVCRIVVSGRNTTLGQGWEAGQSYFIGDNGYLTLSPPTSPAVVKRIAVGISSDTILIKDYMDYEII